MSLFPAPTTVTAPARHASTSFGRQLRQVLVSAGGACASHGLPHSARGHFESMILPREPLRPHLPITAYSGDSLHAQCGGVPNSWTEGAYTYG